MKVNKILKETNYYGHFINRLSLLSCLKDNTRLYDILNRETRGGVQCSYRHGTPLARRGGGVSGRWREVAGWMVPGVGGLPTLLQWLWATCSGGAHLGVVVIPLLISGVCANLLHLPLNLE